MFLLSLYSPLLILFSTALSSGSSNYLEADPLLCRSLIIVLMSCTGRVSIIGLIGFLIGFLLFVSVALADFGVLCLVRLLYLRVSLGMARSGCSSVLELLLYYGRS